MSEQAAVYRLYDTEDQLLYVGLTANPSKRWTEHATSKSWWGQVARKDIEWFDSRADAARAELTAIEEEEPLHNVQHTLGNVPADAATVFANFKREYEARRNLEPAVMESADRELKAGATVGQLAKLTGLTPEVFRRRARALGIEHKRPPTVGKLRPDTNEGAW